MRSNIEPIDREILLTNAFNENRRAFDVLRDWAFKAPTNVAANIALPKMDELNETRDELLTLLANYRDDGHIRRIA